MLAGITILSQIVLLRNFITQNFLSLKCQKKCQKNEKFALPADPAVYPALAEAKVLVSLGKISLEALMALKIGFRKSINVMVGEKRAGNRWCAGVAENENNIVSR